MALKKLSIRLVSFLSAVWHVYLGRRLYRATWILKGELGCLERTLFEPRQVILLVFCAEKEKLFLPWYYQYSPPSTDQKTFYATDAVVLPDYFSAI